MKKSSKVLLGLLGVSLLLAGCGAKDNASTKESKTKEDKVIKVATALDSSEKILNIANKEAEKEGYTIEIVRVNDNVQYNKLLNEKEVDANFSQHGPFMEEFNEAQNGNLVIAQKVYDARVGFYSKEYKTFSHCLIMFSHISIPLPAGLSHCVTTPTTSNLLSFVNVSKKGTPMGAEEKNTTL